MATKLVASLILPLCFMGPLGAKEGMWIPTLLQALEDEMQAMGLRLTAEDIYSINQSSLKDAVVHFGGGCTAEMVSSQGLLLTNHHCGYGEIQYHSTVENDYLKDGFWAMSMSEELPNPNLTATFIHRIIDVSARVLASIDGLDGEERAEAKNKAYSEIEAEMLNEEHLTGGVVEFDFGNQYFLISKITYKDVRLVGAPPSAVGKFGGDTDNWVWPRHTGDFSVFRIYADEDNMPSEYSESNVPYKPAHHFPVSIKGVKDGDFTMVFGFPGTTEQFLTSDAVEHVIEEYNPMNIAMRDASLAVINAARSSSDELRIAYASKQSSIANAWKKWMGQSAGLKELDAVGTKKALEADFKKMAQKRKFSEYRGVIDSIQAANLDYFPYMEARRLFIEFVYYGPDILLHSFEFSNLIEHFDTLNAKGELDKHLDRLLHVNEEYAKNYDASVDQGIFAALAEAYLGFIEDDLKPEEFAEDFARFGSSEEYASNFYKSSLFDNPNQLEALLNSRNSEAIKALKDDPAFELINELRSNYFAKISPSYSSAKEKIKTATAAYSRGLREMYPDEVFIVDANSTLRLTYGRVEGSSPHDGMTYNALSTTKGILQKYQPGHPDFDLPLDLVEKLKAGDWGQYGTGGDESELVVCFTGSNHTTGGNSGSPAINGDGELVGINFDRTWESTMSDILFDESRCRNIMVDIRYVLWIIDHYAGAGHLVDEMTIVR
mgnify:CR=1 FL=1